MYLIAIIKNKTHVCRFLLAYQFMQVAPRYLDFSYKWSWNLCVIPLWWITYNVIKLTNINYLVMYLVAIVKKKTHICRFLLSYQFMQVAPRRHDFWYKCSWGICVIPLWWITYNVNKLTHITCLAMYLVTIIKKLKFVALCLLNSLCYTSCTLMPRLLKKMVMSPLYDTNMMNYILCEQIDPL